MAEVIKPQKTELSKQITDMFYKYISKDFYCEPIEMRKEPKECKYISGPLDAKCKPIDDLLALYMNTYMTEGFVNATNKIKIADKKF